MLSAKAVDFFAHRNGIQDRAVAEREIVLTYALGLLGESDYLDAVTFKGGTCIRKLWVGQTGRFSMDLDFTAREEMIPEDTILELMRIFNQRFHGIQFELEDDWRITHGGLLFTTQPSYHHEWNPAGGFDVQVSLRERPTLDVHERPQIEQSYFKGLEFMPQHIPCLDEHEIVSEKIRAAYQRAKVRDVYDLFVYSKRSLDRGLVRRLAVIKLWQVREILDPAAFISRIQAARYEWNDLRQLVRSTITIDQERIMSQIAPEYAFLKELTDEEVVLAADAKAHREQERWLTMCRSCRRRRETGSF